MADKKITELPLSGALDGTEIVPIVQGGITSQATTQDIADLGGGTQTLQSVTDAGNTTTKAITAKGFVKSGGTSSQFLKADGSVDSTTYISGITSGMVTTALGFTPYDATNPSGFITSSALTPYLTTASAALTYFPIPTGTTSQYVRGDGTLASFPTIPSITGLVPYTGATANVDLGTHSLTASDLIINHVSGSGVAVSITKGGNDEALTVVKSSGSGNVASFTGGNTFISTLTTPTINGVSGLLRFGSTDVLNIGNAAVNVGTLGIVRIGQGASWLDFGQKSSGLASVWANQATPSVNNFCFGGTSSDSYFNAPSGSGSIYLQNANSIIATFARFNFIFTPLLNNYGGNKTAFTFTNPDNLNQTNGIATPSLLYNGGSRNWLTGNITTQSEIIWGGTTYSFVGASTITNAYGNVFNAPIAGLNCTITNRFAALFNQQISLTQTVTTETAVQTRTVTIVINGVTYKLLAA